jgi:hypothetical protein
MTIALLVAVVVLVVVHQWSTDRMRTAHDRTIGGLLADHQEHITSLLAQKNPDLEQMISLVEELCQRIQAPEQAVIDHSFDGQQIQMPSVVAMDDDEAFHETKEQLAERLAMAEVGA